MTEVITRKLKNGKCVEETRQHVDWEPNEADLDIVTVGCDCGHTFNIAWDAMAFGCNQINCGQCGEAGKMKIIEDPAKAT